MFSHFVAQMVPTPIFGLHAHWGFSGRKWSGAGSWMHERAVHIPQAVFPNRHDIFGFFSSQGQAELARTYPSVEKGFASTPANCSRTCPFNQ